MTGDGAQAAVAVSEAIWLLVSATTWSLESVFRSPDVSAAIWLFENA